MHQSITEKIKHKRASDGTRYAVGRTGQFTNLDKKAIKLARAMKKKARRRQKQAAV